MSNTNNVYADNDKRMLILSDDIDNCSIAKVMFNLLFILHIDDEREAKEINFKREPIKLYINSDGGEVYDMWGLIDIMLNSKTPIHTYCTGHAMSAGFEIFLAGHKRFCYKHSTFLYHQPSFSKYGTYMDMVEKRTEVDYINAQSEQFVSERTKLTEEDIQTIRNLKQDFYIHSDKAVEYGIVDEVL